MGFMVEQRESDSPLVDSVTCGYTVGSGSVIRPAETHWHMVFVRMNGKTQTTVAGPLKTSGVVQFSEGAEILWIKFKLGTWFSHLPICDFVDVETVLPDAATHSFWLKGSAWQHPDFENSDTFVERLVRQEVLLHDPVVEAALQGQPIDLAARTVRHRFAQATGLTQAHIEQFQRAQRATEMLQQGASILDTVYELGYFDQPHLTRALKQFVGYTPAQLMRLHRPDNSPAES